MHSKFAKLIKSHIRDYIKFQIEQTTTADISGPLVPAFGKKKVVKRKKLTKEAVEQPKIRSFYHKFTGSDIVVFCESVSYFLECLGIAKQTSEHTKLFNYVNENFSYFIPLKVGDINFLVFSESEIRLLEGKINDSLVETTLALWSGYKKYPSDQQKMYETAIDLLKNHLVFGPYKKLVEFYNTKFENKIDLIEFEETEDTTKVDLTKASEIVFEDHIQRVTKNLIIEKTDSIISHLKSGQAFNISISNIETVLFKEDARFSACVKLVESFGIPTKGAEEIVEQSVKLGEFYCLRNYIASRTLTIEDLRNNSNLYETLIQHTDLSKYFLEWMISYKWPGLPSVGKGEAALAILLKNGVKPSKGDVAIETVLYEVKGTCGTLRGQRGYGSGLDATKVFIEQFMKIYDERNVSFAVLPELGNTKWNISSRNEQILQNQLAEQAVTGLKIKRERIVEIWEKAIRSIYLEMNTNWIDSEIDKSGKITENFIKRWFVEALKYYHLTEQFEAIIAIDGPRVAVLYPNEFDRANEFLTIKKVPSFTSQAGTQGISFSIGVR